MKTIKRYINFWFAITKDEWGWDYDIATPYVSIKRTPIENLNDWSIVIHLILVGCIIGWQTKKKEKS